MRSKITIAVAIVLVCESERDGIIFFAFRLGFFMMLLQSMINCGGFLDSMRIVLQNFKKGTES